jgi:hypothetical protein
VHPTRQNYPVVCLEAVALVWILVSPLEAEEKLGTNIYQEQTIFSFLRIITKRKEKFNSNVFLGSCLVTFSVFFSIKECCIMNFLVAL